MNTSIHYVLVVVCWIWVWSSKGSSDLWSCGLILKCVSCCPCNSFIIWFLSHLWFCSNKINLALESWQKKYQKKKVEELKKSRKEVICPFLLFLAEKVVVLVVVLAETCFFITRSCSLLLFRVFLVLVSFSTTLKNVQIYAWTWTCWCC